MKLRNFYEGLTKSYLELAPNDICILRVKVDEIVKQPVDFELLSAPFTVVDRLSSKSEPFKKIDNKMLKQIISSYLEEDLKKNHSPEYLEIYFNNYDTTEKEILDFICKNYPRYTKINPPIIMGPECNPLFTWYDYHFLYEAISCEGSNSIQPLIYASENILKENEEKLRVLSDLIQVLTS